MGNENQLFLTEKCRFIAKICEKYRYVFVVLLFAKSLLAVAGTAQQLLIETKNRLLVFTVGTNGKVRPVETCIGARGNMS